MLQVMSPGGKALHHEDTTPSGDPSHTNVQKGSGTIWTLVARVPVRALDLSAVRAAATDGLCSPGGTGLDRCRERQS